MRESRARCIKAILTEYSEYVLEKPLFSWYHKCIITNGGVLYVRTKFSSENEALRSKVNVLEEELAMANQKLEWFRKQIFGRKTEQTSVVMEKEFGVQLSMFGNIEE